MDDAVEIGGAMNAADGATGGSGQPSDANVLRRALDAKRKLAGGFQESEILSDQFKQQSEHAAEHADKYIVDSWIGECEAAGVYSRQTPVFRYAEKPNLAVSLTRSELRVLAERHLNTVLMHGEYQAWNGDCERLAVERAMVHESRFWQLCEQLPSEDQEQFKRQIEIRRQYITSVKAEVRRCGEEETAFWGRVEAGLVSEAEIAAHVTPPFIRGSCVMPAPADGGPGPEEWEMFDRYDENSFADSNEVANGGT